jgi:large subunit ribosomal protein L29
MKNSVHELTEGELIAKYAELKEELFNLRFRHATNQLENPKSLNTVKKDIARVLTECKIRGIDVKKNAVKAQKAKKPAKKAVKEAKVEEKTESKEEK